MRAIDIVGPPAAFTGYTGHDGNGSALLSLQSVSKVGQQRSRADSVGVQGCQGCGEVCFAGVLVWQGPVGDQGDINGSEGRERGVEGRFVRFKILNVEPTVLDRSGSSNFEILSQRREAFLVAGYQIQLAATLGKGSGRGLGDGRGCPNDENMLHRYSPKRRDCRE